MNSFAHLVSGKASDSLPFYLLFLNDIEDHFIHSDFEGLDLDMFNLFMLLYADDIVIFANNAEELQLGLKFLSDYCTR